MPDNLDFSEWLGDHPEVIAILLVVVGWMVARMVRHAVTAAIPWINRAMLRLGAPTGSIVTPAFTKALQFLAYWSILLTSVVAALYILGGGGLSGWLDGLLDVVPQLLVALGILTAGHLLGLLVRSLVVKFSGAANRDMLPLVAYGLVAGTAAVTALEHLGLDVSFLTHILLVIVTVFLAGLALAFALGARALVANLSAQGELQRYRPGTRLLVDDIEGTVVEIHRTGIVLSTSDGLAAVPASKFATSTVIEKRTEPAADG
jgi:hypothetical protein